MLIAGLVWGLGFVAQETAMEDIGPLQFVAMRFSLATLALLPFVLRELRRASYALSPGDWWSVISVGIVFFLMMSTQQIGILGTSVTNAGMLTGLYVVLVPLINLALFRQLPSWFVWPASILAFAGIWLLGGGGLDRFTWGDGLIIICAVFSALQVIMVGRSVGRIGLPFTVATAQFAVSAVLGWVGFLSARSIDWALEPAFSQATFISALPEIAYAALVAGALAFTLQAVAQRYTNPGTAAILLSSEALFAALGGAVILAERLDLIGYAGCALLLLAIIITSALSARQDSKNPV